MNFLNSKFIFLFILLKVLFFYFVYSYVIKKIGILLVKRAELKKNYNSFVSSIKLPLSKIGNKFTYSFWLYLNNYSENIKWNDSFDSDKVIINREDSSPKITYNPKYNLLKIYLNYKDDNNTNQDFILETNNIKLQKWQYIVVTLDDRKLNLFLDKNLERSGYIPNVPFLFNKNLLIGDKYSNINGSIFHLKYFNYVISKKDIEKEYKKDKYII